VTNNDLIALLTEVQENLARHVFGPESPACVMCGGESGFDVGRACPEAHDYDLLQRVKLAQRRMLRAQERVSCGHCGEQKTPDKVCGHCAEDS
jgi:hypothetical protein